MYAFELSPHVINDAYAFRAAIALIIIYLQTRNVILYERK